MTTPDLIAEARAQLPSRLPAYFARQRWFGGKARKLQSVEIVDAIPARTNECDAVVFLAAIHYADGAKDFYSLPFIFSEDSANDEQAELSFITGSKKTGRTLTLTDALKHRAFQLFLLDLIEKNRSLRGLNGGLFSFRTTAFPADAHSQNADLTPRAVNAEQSNSSVIYGQRMILKLFRRLEEGMNPDLEIAGFLTETANFRNTPRLFGSLEYRAASGKPMSQAILQEFIPNQGDAWSFTLRSLSDFYSDLANDTNHADSPPSNTPAADSIQKILAPYLESASLLAKRTAELHLALASDSTNNNFSPEPFTETFQHGFRDSVVSLTTRVFSQLTQKVNDLPEDQQPKAKTIALQEKTIVDAFQVALAKPIHAARIRIHGDYHLGQVLYTGADFIIVDFEGEPARPLAERRLKRSPLQDVAGMLRSFHYATHAALIPFVSDTNEKNGHRHAELHQWAELWNATVRRAFLKQYFASAGSALFLPASNVERNALLQIHLLEKAVYELGYELNNRPAWVGIPLEGISQVLQGLQENISHLE
jgi:trehalose synthase-fused probable maltokinase